VGLMEVDLLSFADLGNIKLHYVDWKGKMDGPLLILIPGFEDTALVYYRIAHKFTPYFHVVAITCRGFGRSVDQANGENWFNNATEDLSNFMTFLGQSKAILIGHSLSGDIMTPFAGKYPERVLSLVYLDAAYDRSAEAMTPFFNNDLKPNFRMLPHNPYSFELVKKCALEEYQGYWGEETERNLLEIYIVKEDGIAVNRKLKGYRKKVLGQTVKPDYSLVQCPALAMYSLYHPDKPVFCGGYLPEVDMETQKKN